MLAQKLLFYAFKNVKLFYYYLLLVLNIRVLKILKTKQNKKSVFLSLLSLLKFLFQMCFELSIP